MCFNELEGLEDNREDRFMTNFCRRGGALVRDWSDESQDDEVKKKKKTLKASVAFRAAAAASGTLTLQQW